MPLSRVSAPGLARSSSVPADRRYVDASRLPDILHPSAQHLQAASPTKLSSFPSRTAQPLTQWECKPAALEEIEDFIAAEVGRLPKRSMDSGVRLQVFREAFDLFIAHFKVYAAPLSEIKRAYDAHITELLRAAKADRERGEDTELVELFERTTSSLRSELRHKEKQLATALEQLRELQTQHIAMMEEQAGGSPVSKLQGAVVASKRSATLLKMFEGACDDPSEIAEAVQKLSGQIAKPQQLAACAASARRLELVQQAQLAAEIIERLPAKERGRLLPLLAQFKVPAVTPAKRVSILETAVGDMCAELEPAARAAAVGAAVGRSADLPSRIEMLRPQLAARPPQPSSAATATTEQQAAAHAAAASSSLGHEPASLGCCDELLPLLMEQWGGAAPERVAALLALLPPERARAVAHGLLAAAGGGENAPGGPPPPPPQAAPAAAPAATSAYQLTPLGPDPPEVAAARRPAPPLRVEGEASAEMRVEVVRPTTPRRRYSACLCFQLLSLHVHGLLMAGETPKRIIFHRKPRHAISSITRLGVRLGGPSPLQLHTAHLGRVEPFAQLRRAAAVDGAVEERRQEGRVAAPKQSKANATRATV